MSYAAFVMSINKFVTTDYPPFGLVYGRPPMHLVDLALSFDGFLEMIDVTEYAESVREWLEVAKEKVQKKVNRAHDVHAPRFNAHRSDSTVFKSKDSALDWRRISCKVTLTTKLSRKYK